MHIKAIITKSNKDPKIPVDPESSFDNLLKICSRHNKILTLI